MASAIMCWSHRKPAILAVVIFSILAGCSRNPEGDNYTHIRSEDSAMNAAIAEAQRTANDFVSALNLQKPGTKDYFVKKPYPTPSGSKEHIWIAVVKEDNGLITGRIANDAEETREVKLGQTVTLQISEISDWKYQDGNKLIGGYTIRYFIEKMSPKEREGFLKNAGFEL